MKKDICQTCVHNLERDGESGWNCDCYGYGITKMSREEPYRTFKCDDYEEEAQDG